MKDARAALEAAKLEEYELIESLDVKNLYTHVSVEEATEIDLNELYASSTYFMVSYGEPFETRRNECSHKV